MLFEKIANKFKKINYLLEAVGLQERNARNTTMKFKLTCGSGLHVH